jgi:hypothetical protein
MPKPGIKTPSCFPHALLNRWLEERALEPKTHRSDIRERAEETRWARSLRVYSQGAGMDPPSEAAGGPHAVGEGTLDSCEARLRRGVSTCWVDNMERTRGCAQIRSCRGLGSPGSRHSQIDVASQSVEVCTTGFVEH